MKSSLYSIYDTKAKYYSKPFQAQNDQVATRMIANTFSDPNASQSEYVKNPEDFKLFRLAEFDDSTGYVESTHEPIIDFTAFKQEDQDNEE
jgi:hypothetical protein